MDEVLYFYPNFYLTMRAVSSKFLWLSLLLLLVFILNMSLGSVILPRSVWVDLLHGHVSETYQGILHYRLLKAFAAVLAGGGLALSGLLLQTMFRNPIVGPYVLGMSSGAGLGVALLFLGGSFFGFSYFSGLTTGMAAALGSLWVLLVIIGLYYKFKNPVHLLIAGLMIGFFTSAVISILSYFTDATSLQKFVFWAMGTLGSQSVSQLWIIFIVLLISVIFSFLFFKDLNLLLLGEEYALSMGVSVKRIHFLIVILTGILVGVITAFFGPIGFVGLAVPHLSRRFFDTHLHQILIPVNVLLGAILLLVCDVIAQVPGSIISLPINSVTAIFGAPLVVYMLLKDK